MLAHVRYITGRNTAIDTGHSGKQPMLLRQYYFEFHLIKHFQKNMKMSQCNIITHGLKIYLTHLNHFF